MRAVKATVRAIHATDAEIDRAMDAALGLRADTRTGRAETSAAATDWAALCARLETQTGIKAEEWLWRRSGAYAILSYNDLHAFARAHSGRGGDRMLDELDAAMTHLAKLKASIVRRTEEAGHGDR